MTPALVEWTDERVATLRRLWPDYISHEQIAEACGTTRAAVVAKGRRLGLPIIDRPSSEKPRFRDRARPKQPSTFTFLPPLPLFTPSPPPPPSPAARLATLAEDERKAIAERYGAIVRVAA